MGAPVAALLGDGTRLHLQHGPIDLIIGVDAAMKSDRQRAFAGAARRFETVLSELAGELDMLRRPVSQGTPAPKGDVARRMDMAVRPFARRLFVTPMAAVAGAVADEVLSAMLDAAPLSRAYVNNGGDIALHLLPPAQYSAAIAGLDGAAHGQITIDAASDVRGIATSGQGGRSLSFGIADSVTVLAANAACADVAATLIANAVDLPAHPAITRVPARDVDPESDLGARPVVTHVGPLAGGDVQDALGAGATFAQALLEEGLILGAALCLHGAQHIVGAVQKIPVTQFEMVKHA
jgi:ApbE superfamily uncharacterized protein (UPF0280 family)